jgi:hypothetical protein
LSTVRKQNIYTKEKSINKTSPTAGIGFFLHHDCSLFLRQEKKVDQIIRLNIDNKTSNSRWNPTSNKTYSIDILPFFLKHNALQQCLLIF